MTERQLEACIKGCRKMDPVSQKELYTQFYSYGMSIASRYGRSLEDVEEIANDSFYKMLSKISSYKNSIPFKLWLRRIIINTGIDFYRKHKNKIESELRVQTRNVSNGVEAEHQKEFLESLLNLLSPQYKLVFVLHVLEGFSHAEIAEKLKIGVGTSKSNLSKARIKLKKLLLAQEQKFNYERQSIR